MTINFSKPVYSFLLLALLSVSAFAQQAGSELQRLSERAKNVEIIRDNYGVPHIYGETDADAVFGMLYVQCEDDFARVERNYLDAIGLMSMAYGEKYIYHDLRARLFMDSTLAKGYYEKSPQWMKDLCDGFADGINYYLMTHPATKPDYITHFRNWMPFTFSEGSIGGDITRIPLKGLEAFYGNKGQTYLDERDPLLERPTGSNGFSISPKKSATGNALFLINPHTSFYFRSELHVNSNQGLKSYGAVTWGQFFIYQGFNENCGWMHTSTYADAIDTYKETISKQGEKYYYQYGEALRPVEERRITIPYMEDGDVKFKSFDTYYTHHGPVIRSEKEGWVTFRMMERPLAALTQSFLRTKAKNYRTFKKTMKIKTNSSNNTVYADQKGNIAYWHGNFVPIRNEAYDYNGLIDGSNPETDWSGLHKIKELLHVKNPLNGWIQNCNSDPFTVAGSASPDKSDYPNYSAPDRENFRGVNAVRVLSRRDSFTRDQLIEAANDRYLAAFEKLIPSLVAACESSKMSSEMKEAVSMLKTWNKEFGVESIETSLAVFWGERILSKTRTNDPEGYRKQAMDDYIINGTSAVEKVAALQAAMAQLDEDFGSWKTPWGEINRFQRLTGDIKEQYDDTKPSIPVAFTSSRWGSLGAWGARSYENTKRRYGHRGNSFVAVVEFGKKVNALSVSSGGASNDPKSPHFDDQAEIFATGQFKSVNYYKEDVIKNAEKRYRPGRRPI